MKLWQYRVIVQRDKKLLLEVQSQKSLKSVVGLLWVTSKAHTHVTTHTGRSAAEKNICFIAL